MVAKGIKGVPQKKKGLETLFIASNGMGNA